MTSGSEKLLSNTERFALVIASMANVSDGEQQYRQRKSRPNIGMELTNSVPIPYIFTMEI